MSSTALLKISELANGDSPTKNEDVLNLLLAQDTTHLETVMFYITALTKQQTLPVKTILGQYIDYVANTDTNTISSQQKQKLYEAMVNQFTPPTASVSIALTKTALNLATLYEESKLFHKAIEVLKILNTDVFVQDFQDISELNRFKVQLNSRIARDCLRCEDYESAENHLTRITPLLSTLSNSKELVQQVQKLSVEVTVRMSKWLDAATRLLQMDDIAYDLATVLYSILVPYSPFKLNLFNNITKSDHLLLTIIDTPLSLIFGKMQASRLIYADEFNVLLSFIPPATSSLDFGITSEALHSSLAKAVVENNLIAASKIFETVTLETFAGFLALELELVEDIVAEMVRSGRLLKASVDDVSKVVTFTEYSESDTQFALKEWEDHVVGSCTILDNIVSDLMFEHNAN